jgi:hypothetical protein
VRVDPAGSHRRADTVAAMTRGQAVFLRAFSIWTIYVWVTRIWNIWGDEARSAGFKAVHTVLAVVSVTFAIGGLVIVHRVRRGAARVPVSLEPAEK